MGQQTVLSAVLGNGVADGSVAYLLNGVGISGSMPTVKGVENFQWTPTTGGIATITVNPQGSGAWSVGAPMIVRADSNTILHATSTSGSTVVLGETGPCVLNGAVMTALSAGQCTLTATSPGSATFLPNTATYTITVQEPPRRPRR